MRTTEQRFQGKFIPEPMSGCWLWIAGGNSDGYGTFRYNGKTRPAHVVSYELRFGPVPNGKEIDHKCRVRCCVNPLHLEPVTHLENVRRGLGGKPGGTIAGRLRREQTHCKRGHEFTLENTGKNGDGRYCRACVNAGHREGYRNVVASADREALRARWRTAKTQWRNGKKGEA